jgi:hypothetical protein
MVLSLLRQLSDESAALQSGADPEWVEEHLAARPYADAVKQRAATCKRTVEEEECSICLSELEGAERCRLLPCSHIFHAGCIDRWFERSTLCPCCKAPVKDQGD